MKRNLTTILFASLSFAIFSQISAYEYLYKAPALPENLCRLKTPQQESFLKAVIDLSDSIKKDIQNRTREATEYTENHKEEMQTGILRNVGFTETDIQRIKAGKDMTNTEKQKLINLMMQKKTNISMTEAMNLKHMNEAEQQSCSERYGAERMTVPQANKQLTITEQNVNATTSELLSEQSDLRQNINTLEKTFRKLYESIDSEAEADKKMLENELKPLYEELHSINNGEGSTNDRTRSVTKQVQVLQELFCEKFTPRMTNFLLQCRDSTEKALPDYDRLEEIQYEIVAAQTGTDIMKAGRGIYSLKAIEQYLDYLARVFRYKLHRTEN